MNRSETVARTPVALLLALLVPLAALGWAFWTTLAEFAHAWSVNPQYSHGYLVPIFAAYLLWARRDYVAAATSRPSLFVGVALLAAGIALRLGGAYFYYEWFDGIALLPCVAGVVLLVGGWRALRWALPAICFLVFMVPLPYRLAGALAGPLQRLATVSSVFIMQVLGLPALAEGNVILLNRAEIGIVEACSGLRMLVVFFALATGVALVMRRPLLDRLIVVLSAAPIALLVNLVRITVTGVLHDKVDSNTANAFFHDAAGWFMMPLAMALLWLELKVLAHLFIDAPRAPPPRLPRLATPRRPASERTARPRGGKPARREKETTQPAPAAATKANAGATRR